MLRERRNMQRVNCNLVPALFKARDKSTYCVEIKDLSPVGVRFVAPTFAPMGGKMELLITLPTNSIPKFQSVETEIEIVWVSDAMTQGKIEAGARFTGMSEAAKKSISEYYYRQFSNDKGTQGGPNKQPDG